MHKGLMLLLYLCFLLSPVATAGVDWLPQQHIKSQILKEQRAYRVSLPENYEQSSRQYPLLLLLDGRAVVRPFRLFEGSFMRFGDGRRRLVSR